MFCPKCGSMIDDDSIFCVHCGAAISSSDQMGDREEQYSRNNNGLDYYSNEAGYYPNEQGYRNNSTRPPKQNHTLRNSIIIAVVIAGVGIGAFFGIKAYKDSQQKTVETATVIEEKSAIMPTISPVESGNQSAEQNQPSTGIPTPTAIPTLTTTSTQTVTPTVTPTVQPTPTAAPTPTDEPKPTPTSEPIPTTKPQPSSAPVTLGTNLYVAKPQEGLNVHVSAGINSADIFTVYGSTPMVFYGKTEKGYGSDGALHDWYQIELNNVQGWVRSDLIRSSGDGYYIKNVEGAMNMRDDHRYDSDIAATLYENTRLRLTGQTGTGYGSDGQMHDWYLVETAQPIVGWVRGDLTTG